MLTDIIKFDLPKEQSSIIKVIGVGGGGSNAVNHMYKQGIKGVNFVICNTDAQALEASPVPNKIQLGASLTEGRGAGSIPEVGRNAAIENIEDIKNILSKNTKMVFITAGMGGGTGTGAAPIIAQTAREMGILTVGIVTLPFAFEGRKRRQQAEEGLAEIRKHVDTLLVISNEKLREMYGNLTLTNAFAQADNILTTAAKGIAEIITVTGYINVDFADVQTVMTNGGSAIMGTGIAEGSNRATKAVEHALTSPLLNDNNISGARYVLLYIAAGTSELLMDEVTEITDYVQDAAGMTADIIWGNGTDNSLGDAISVTIIATGFNTAEQNRNIAQKKPEKIVLKEEENKTINSFNANAMVANGQMEQAKKEEPFLKTDSDEQVKLDLEVPVQGKLVYNDFSKSANPQRLSAEEFLKLKEEEEAKKKAQANERLLKAKERMEKIREINMKLKNPAGLSEMETVPAYIRKKVELDNVQHSSEQNISRLSLVEDEQKKLSIKSNNSFLHDNVD